MEILKTDLRTYVLLRCAELREETLRRRLKPATDELLLQGLLVVLPPIGAPFPEEKRKLWFEMARATFDLLYDAARLK